MLLLLDQVFILKYRYIKQFDIVYQLLVVKSSKTHRSRAVLKFRYSVDLENRNLDCSISKGVEQGK
jgi:hypothetical protein